MNYSPKNVVIIEAHSSVWFHKLDRYTKLVYYTDIFFFHDSLQDGEYLLI